MSDQFEVWTAVAQLLRAQLTESVWYSTFSEVVPQVDDDAAALVIQVPSTLARDRILTRYQPLNGIEQPASDVATKGIVEFTDAGRAGDVNFGNKISNHI